MVSGFTIDPIHAMTDGTFVRRVVGFCSVVAEEKLEPSQIEAVNIRLDVFKDWVTDELDRELVDLSGFPGSKIHVKRQFLYHEIY